MAGQFGKYSVLGGSGGGGGVTTVNSLTGAVTLAAGTNITITPSGNTLTIASTSGGTVTDVTASSPLASSGGTTPNISLTGIVAIVNGGTGQATANAAFNALAPSQAGNSGKFLTTNGTDTSWATVSGGANTALSNVASTAVGADLNPGTDALVALGSVTKRWSGLNTLSLVLHGSTSGALTVNASATTTSHTLTFPSAQGAANTVLSNNGSGVLSWSSTAGNANTSLSNLTATSINQDLLPDTDDGRVLGSPTKRWGPSYIFRLLDPGGIRQIDLGGRTLYNAAAQAMLDWSGASVDFNGKNLINAADHASRYFSSTTTISGTLATIVYATVDYDGSASYNNTTGVYTASTAGKYLVNASLLISGTVSLNNTGIMEIQKNGTVVSRETLYFPAAITNGYLQISDIINCAATDTIRIQVSTAVATPSIVASNFDNFISITRLI